MKCLNKLTFTMLMLSIALDAGAESIRDTLNRQNAFKYRAESQRIRRELDDSIREERRYHYESEKELREYENSERRKYFLNEPSTYDPMSR